METNKILIAAIAIIAFVIGFAFGGAFNKGGQLGSATHFSGPIDSEEGFSVDDTAIIDGSGNITAVRITATDGIILNGGVFSTTTGALGTTTAAQVCAGYSLWSVSPESTATTLYFPATTTLYADCLTANGMTVSFSIHNATSGPNGVSAITLSEGWEQGMSLIGSSTDSLFILNPMDFAQVVMTRVSVATTTAIVDIFRNK